MENVSVEKNTTQYTQACVKVWWLGGGCGCDFWSQKWFPILYSMFTRFGVTAFHVPSADYDG